MTAVDVGTHTDTHQIGLATYRVADLVVLATRRPRLELAAEVRERITAGSTFVDALVASEEHVYGVNTGFGSLCETRIGANEVEALQYNHIVSHACGIGDSMPEHISRLVMLNKLLTLRSGRTGASLGTVQALVDLWNAGIVPTIPARGSVGASGDLAPLAHMSLPLIGLGSAYANGVIVDGRAALDAAGLPTITLRAKDGLALTNGVQYINGLAVDAVSRALFLARVADLTASLSTQAFSCARTFFDTRYHATSPNRHRTVVAENLGRLTAGGNHYELNTRNHSRQDPYSFRCLPQVHGAARQFVEFVTKVIEDECNGVSDNPLFFSEDQVVLMGGNLHGESTAMALDSLAIAVAELASISERRTFQLLSGKRGLPDFLTTEPGLHSGLMVAQYSAAALVNENKVLASPASVDTIPTCQMQEDHVSMGATSALKLRQILTNCEYVLAIELMTAAQAAELLDGLSLSPAAVDLVSALREVVPALAEDRVLSTDIEAARAFVVGQAEPLLDQWGVQ